MSIKEKLELGILRVEMMPYMLDLEIGDQRINKQAPRPDELGWLEGKMNQTADMVSTPKLKARGYSEWEIKVGMISVDHFESRERFDELFLMNPELSFDENGDRCPIQVAFERSEVFVSANMNYYKSHRHEMEKDLKRSVTDTEVKTSTRKIEQELFYAIMNSVFGTDDSVDDIIPDCQPGDFEKAFMIEDLRICGKKAGAFIMTARRGSYYLGFVYETI